MSCCPRTPAPNAQAELFTMHHVLSFMIELRADVAIEQPWAPSFSRLIDFANNKIEVEKLTGALETGDQSHTCDISLKLPMALSPHTCTRAEQSQACRTRKQSPQRLSQSSEAQSLSPAVESRVSSTHATATL